MVELDQFKYTLSTYVPMLKELGASLNLDAKKRELQSFHVIWKLLISGMTQSVLRR